MRSQRLRYRPFVHPQGHHEPMDAEALLESVRATIQSIKGCRQLKVSHTTLLENEQWKRAARGSEPPSKLASSKLGH
jgi:hypothetical protein